MNTDPPVPDFTSAELKKALRQYEAARDRLQAASPFPVDESRALWDELRSAADVLARKVASELGLDDVDFMP